MDTADARFAAQRFERPEQRRRGFAPADRDANGLEHLTGFDAEFPGGGAQRVFEACVGKAVGAGCEHVFRLFQNADGERGVGLFGNQFGGIVGRQFRREEEICRREHFVERVIRS